MYFIHETNNADLRLFKVLSKVYVNNRFKATIDTISKKIQDTFKIDSLIFYQSLELIASFKVKLVHVALSCTSS